MSVTPQVTTPPPASNPWVPMWNLNPTAYDLRYNGDYLPGSYTDGDIVVFNGITYLCVRPTSAAPTPWTSTFASPSPSVRVYKAAGQSIPNNAWTSITFDTVRYDQGPSSHWAAGSPTRLTCQVAGTYSVQGHILYTPSTAGTQRALSLLLNGTNYIANQGQGAIPSNVYQRIVVSAVMRLNVGDYIELQTFQDSGGALATYGSDATTWVNELSMALVGGVPGPPGMPASLAYGTSLPATPYDGQEAVLVDSITNPSYQWRFRYNAGSTSPYKWEYVGGTSAFSHVAASFGSTSIYTAFTTDAAGPSFTVPRAGEYFASYAATTSNSTVAGDCMLLLVVAGTQRNELLAYGTSPSSPSGSIGRAEELIDVALTAGQVITHGYGVLSAGTANFDRRSLSVHPKRVS